MTCATFLHSNTFRRAVARRRPGATLVECAIALPVMFFVLFALLDLGLAATRYNTLAEVARKIRQRQYCMGRLRLRRTAPGARTRMPGLWPMARRSLHQHKIWSQR